MSSRIVLVCVVLWAFALVAVASRADEPPGIADRADATRRLREAASAGWSKIAAEAIRYGADIEETDEFGTTALILASTRGHEKIVKLLLAAGADPSRENDDHVSPLLAASANCNDPVVTLLLRYGANPNTKNWTRQTPIMRAAENGCHVVVRELMRAKGIDLQLADDSGRTAMDYARESSNLGLDWGESWALMENVGRHPVAKGAGPGRRTLPRGTGEPRSLPKDARPKPLS
jgi:hypothetical protein